MSGWGGAGGHSGAKGACGEVVRWDASCGAALLGGGVWRRPQKAGCRCSRSNRAGCPLSGLGGGRSMAQAIKARVCRSAKRMGMGK